MRVLLLLVIAAAQLFAADDPGREFMELVLADMRRPFPTDAELSQRLVDHRKDFEQLVAMAKAMALRLAFWNWSRDCDSGAPV